MAENQTRTILHVDMDAFYASVELLRRPDLRGRPVVVGGGEGRGVVAAASYEARRYGIRSAMSGAEARRRCPDLVMIRPDHRHYAEVSAEIRKVFETVTPLVEPLALDEAFLDVSGALSTFGSGRSVAEHLRRKIAEALSLDCSVGVASNKFIAKLASVDAKPVASTDGVRPGHGVVVVAPGDEADYVASMPVGRLWGVGPRTRERLAAIGVDRVEDLRRIDQRIVTSAIGEAAAAHLRRLAVGRDDRAVIPDRDAKSIGHEETFGVDIADPAALEAELVRMVDLVAARVRRSVAGARTWSVKIRFDDFTTMSRSHTWASPIDSTSVALGELRPMLSAAVSGRRVRLLGVAASHFGEPVEQLDLFAAAESSAPDRRRAEHAVDEIRGRFGERSIGRASGVRRPSGRAGA
jgi:DNA polymerase-4